MRKVRITICLMVAVLVMAAVKFTSADTIRGIDIDFVTIGNAGNPSDSRYVTYPSSYGAVDYTYQIGKYEVTNGQWDTFVSAAVAPTGNLSNAYDDDASFAGTNIPVDCISWYEAAQFCNYLTSGDKSHGAYLFSGDNTNPGDFIGIDRSLAVSTYGTVYVIPNHDEWHKAAYYTGSDYSTYANGTNVAPIDGVDANYGQIIPFHTGPWNVGSGTIEQNGTFDMMGNVLELNETKVSSSCIIRGGGYAGGELYLRASTIYSRYVFIESSGTGFRVASIPEPATLLLLGLGGLALHKRNR